MSTSPGITFTCPKCGTRTFTGGQPVGMPDWVEYAALKAERDALLKELQRQRRGRDIEQRMLRRAAEIIGDQLEPPNLIATDPNLDGAS